MSNFKKVFLTIFKEQRGLFVMLFLNFFASLVLLFISFFSIKSNVAVVKIGYGDIGGYKDGTWTDMLVFPIMSALLGIIHPIISVRIFDRYGEGVAKVFMFITFLLLVCLFVVFFRLVNEG